MRVGIQAFQQKDMTVLHTLSHKVKTMSVDQCAALGWIPGQAGRRACLARLSALEMMGLVTLEVGVAAVRECRPATLATWRPGTPPPDLRDAHRRAAGLWAHAMKFPKPVRYVRATDAGAAVVGGQSFVVRPSELAHDLHAASVYLITRERDRRAADCWVCESGSGSDARSAARFDAVVRLPGGPVMVEVIGASYTLDTLVDVHGECERAAQGYELW